MNKNLLLGTGEQKIPYHAKLNFLKMTWNELPSGELARLSLGETKRCENEQRLERPTRSSLCRKWTKRAQYVASTAEMRQRGNRHSCREGRWCCDAHACVGLHDTRCKKIPGEIVLCWKILIWKKNMVKFRYCQKLGKFLMGAALQAIGHVRPIYFSGLQAHEQGWMCHLIILWTKYREQIC